MSCSHCKPPISNRHPTADTVVDTPQGDRRFLEREHLEQLQRKIGQERGERERLERLVVEVTEALRPLRGLHPHPIVDVWSRSAQAALAALDAYASEKEPAQQVMADEPQRIGGESPEDFYKRTAQRLREEIEIEAAKVVDRDRKIERLERIVEEQADLIRGQDERDEKHRQEMFQARLALREMAKLV